MQASKNIFTVSKLNRLARNILEAEIGQIWLTAEISNFVAATSGHWYFTLKDERAQIRAAMFKPANRLLRVRPKEGDKVLVRAKLSLYEPRGDYQLIVEHLEAEGEGQLKRAFEQLKEKLSGEGLFSQQCKKSLPQNILKVGIVTSPTGAALHDILSVLARRNPAIQLVVYPTQVQGESAPEQICDAIQAANQRNEVQVLIVGRGGGSLEDLNCFNHEQVARVLFASRLPVVSAVGHEVDVTIADFVADVRAPTPSAAAEMISQDQQEVREDIAAKVQVLHQRLANQLKDCRHRSQLADQRLLQNHPKNRLQQQYQYLDQLVGDLSSAVHVRLVSHCEQVNKLTHRLTLHSPGQSLQPLRQTNSELTNRLTRAWQAQLTASRYRLAGASQLLDSVSPLATLARGYSISFKNGEIVKSTQQIQPGDSLTTRLNDGEIISRVVNIEES